MRSSDCLKTIQNDAQPWTQVQLCRDMTQGCGFAAWPAALPCAALPRHRVPHRRGHTRLILGCYNKVLVLHRKGKNRVEVGWDRYVGTG